MRRRALLASGVLLGVLLGGACTIDTGEDLTAATTAPTTVPPTDDTLPPDPAGTDPVDHLGDAHVQVSEVARVDHPVALTSRSGSQSLYVLERRGTIREVAREFSVNPTTGARTLDRIALEPGALLELGDLVDPGDDGGAIDLTFSTDGRTVYVSYVDSERALAVDRWAVDDRRADPRSRQTLVRVEEVADTGAVGGALAIGPDGFLYIALGGAAGAGERSGTAQDLEQLPGSLLRIDVEAGGDDLYLVPRANPYHDDPDALAEIWLKGVRDPRYLAFDRVTGSMWLIDNGESAEEINFLPSWERGGRAANLGWPNSEGAADLADDHVAPLHSYGHDVGCRAVGGVAYRGREIPGLTGAYVWGDQCTGQVRALLERAGKLIDERVLAIELPPETLTAIAEGPDAEIYVLVSTGQVYRVDPAPPPEEEPDA